MARISEYLFFILINLVYGGINNLQCISSISTACNENLFDSFLDTSLVLPSSAKSTEDITSTLRLDVVQVGLRLPEAGIPSSLRISFGGDRLPNWLHYNLCYQSTQTSFKCIWHGQRNIGDAYGCGGPGNCASLSGDQCLVDDTCVWTPFTIQDFSGIFMDNTQETPQAVKLIRLFFDPTTDVTLLNIDFVFEDQCLDLQETSPSNCVGQTEEQCRQSSQCGWRVIDDGNWSEWGDYDTTVGCENNYEVCNQNGERTRTRLRKCNNPAPSDHFGNECLSGDLMTAFDSCPDDFEVCVPGHGSWSEPEVIQELYPNDDCRSYKLQQSKICVNTAADIPYEIDDEHCPNRVFQQLIDTERSCRNFEGVRCVDEENSWKWYDCANILDHNDTTSWETYTPSTATYFELTIDFGRETDLRGWELHYGVVKGFIAKAATIIFYIGDTLESVSDSNSERIEYQVSGAIESLDMVRTGREWLDLSSNRARFIRFKFLVNANTVLSVKEIIFFGYECGISWYASDAPALSVGQYCSLGAVAGQPCLSGYSCEGGIDSPPLPCPRGSYCTPTDAKPILCPGDQQSSLSDPGASALNQCASCSNITDSAACDSRDHCFFHESCEESLFLLQTTFTSSSPSHVTQEKLDQFTSSVSAEFHSLCPVEGETYYSITDSGITLNLVGYHACMETWAQQFSKENGLFARSEYDITATPNPNILSNEFSIAVKNDSSNTLPGSLVCPYECVILSPPYEETRPVFALCEGGRVCLDDPLNAESDSSSGESWVAAVFIGITITLCCLLAVVFLFRTYHSKQKAQVQAVNRGKRLSERGQELSEQDEWKNQREANQEIDEYQYDGEEGGGVNAVGPGSQLDVHIISEVNRPDQNVGELANEGSSANLEGSNFDLVKEGSNFNLQSEPGTIRSQRMPIKDFGGSFMSSGTESDLYAAPKDGEGNVSGAGVTGAPEIIEPEPPMNPGLGRRYGKSVEEQTFPDLPGLDEKRNVGHSNNSSMSDMFAASEPGNDELPGFNPALALTPGAIHVDFYSTFIEKVHSYESLFIDSTELSDSDAKVCIAELRGIPTNQVVDQDVGIQHIIGRTEEQLRILLRRCPMPIVSDLAPSIDLETLQVVE